MSHSELDETRRFWDQVAADWRVQVGDEGDANRRLNSDPVLWALAGDVRGLTVLDAGCGTGYLTRKLADAGAQVVGVDFSEAMIDIARAQNPHLDFRVDSCSSLTTVADATFDRVVSNYVLMDTPELDAAVTAFHRVLKQGGVAVAVFSHPCFPQGGATVSEDREKVDYHWDFPYFEQRKCVDPPWAHFKSDFIWFHRPLSDYWKAFTKAGFSVVDFEEPRITADRFHLAADETKLMRSKSRPYSVAFKLMKR